MESLWSGILENGPEKPRSLLRASLSQAWLLGVSSGSGCWCWIKSCFIVLRTTMSLALPMYCGLWKARTACGSLLSSMCSTVAKPWPSNTLPACGWSRSPVAWVSLCCLLGTWSSLFYLESPMAWCPTICPKQTAAFHTAFQAGFINLYFISLQEVGCLSF